ncbi:MAG TPA: hypothetical protein PKZ12_05080 [Smithellaceae bacterium]|nr:hypothetical protein [Smithellaceae bacterium]
MKKLITISLVTILLAALLATSAFAFGPGGNRYNDRGRQDRIHGRYDYRDHRDNRWRHVQRPPVRHVPAPAHRPVVVIPPPHVAGFSLFLPHFSIVIR